MGDGGIEIGCEVALSVGKITCLQGMHTLDVVFRNTYIYSVIKLSLWGMEVGDKSLHHVMTHKRVEVCFNTNDQIMQQDIKIGRSGMVSLMVSPVPTSSLPRVSTIRQNLSDIAYNYQCIDVMRSEMRSDALLEDNEWSPLPSSGRNVMRSEMRSAAALEEKCSL